MGLVTKIFVYVNLCFIIFIYFILFGIYKSIGTLCSLNCNIIIC
ncbi:054R [Invertebrate iridescent virus Kaz2018]|uniref:054R n=1 Tax=Invertebrate iridescent virus 6 TaxID=176652 RepID=Q91G46_IIV6|nr:054R [Invertebrate iridescent virus 6]AAK81986.1 054R [Invertebrate iridescent virus 6]QMS79530.1 hypothetical protein IIV6-T1_059 [Invertebrate iridescent virus 6]QNH08465.1 054R [Invertebrate iridescent virus Kaz2018]